MLDHLKAKPHPAKAILTRDYGLTIVQIAKYLGVSYVHCCNMLSGLYNAKKHDKKLNELIEVCQKERAGNA